jgi:Rrf2 family nitric oxide-sensitive transcriptional repressor
MFSHTVEYALRAVVWLADQYPEPLTTRQIAASTQVPAGYLSKVLQGLARTGLVQAQRGLHGGFTLARSPERISILDVINAVDPLQRIHTCPLSLDAHGTNLCPLHKRLDDTIATIEKALGESSIADLLARPGTTRPLCAENGQRRAMITIGGRAKR